MPPTTSFPQEQLRSKENCAEHPDRKWSRNLDSCLTVSSSSTNVNREDIVALKAHNALQPISRLSTDILEYLFLLGASLASSSRSSPLNLSSTVTTSIHHRDSPTRTILTYAQLTSPLRHVATSSPRLWVRLIDFERASERWTEELLRRSAGVSLELVFQWSKAQRSFPRHHVTPKFQTHRGAGEEMSKKMRLENMVRYEVLSRARNLGVAAPAPYFADVLLDKLSGFGRGGKPRLESLESLRIVRSPARRMSGMVEGAEMAELNEEKERAAGYVPLTILDAAPNLQELAIAESCLPFHELFREPLPSESTPSTMPTPPLRHSSSGPYSPLQIHNSQVLHTLSNLKVLHIVDLPLHLAPSAREWLIYFTATPALEELVLEGAMISAADLSARAEERAHLRGEMDTEAIWDDDGGDSRWQGMDVASHRLPRLRVLTLDAALEDVSLLVTSLPTPAPMRRVQLFRSQTNSEPAKNYEWMLRCAGARAADGEALDRLMAVFSRAAGVDGRSTNVPLGPHGAQGSTRVGGDWAPVEQHAALSATETDVHIHLRSGLPEAPSSIHLQLHIGRAGDAPAPTTAPGQSVQPPSESLVKYALGSLESTVMPRLTSLEIDLAPYADTTPLRNALRQAGKVTRLSIGKRGAKGVLKMLQGGPLGRNESVCSRLSSSSSSFPSNLGNASTGDFSIPTGATALLPLVTILDLVDDGAAGPVWTALLRCVRARRAAGTPVARVNFISVNGGNGQRLACHVTNKDDKSGPAPGSSGNILSIEQAKELQNLDVSVRTHTNGYLL